jgi:hypothetical protein
MDQIVIQDLEVFYRVGVPDQERTHAQRTRLSLLRFPCAGRNSGPCPWPGIARWARRA